MPLTYPVPEDARWDVWDTDTGTFDTRTKDGVTSDIVNIKWPRKDRMQLPASVPANIVLLRRINTLPTFDPATQKLGNPTTPVVDLVEQTITRSRAVVALTAEELQAIADAEADAAELAQLKAVYLDLKNGVGTSTQRLVRVEKVLARVMRDNYGE